MRSRREASAALEDAHRRGQPFFLMMAPYAVHVPIQPHGRFVERYRGKTFPGTDVAIDEREANYASMVEGVDAALGTLLQRLDELEIADRTLVLFTSDNGGLSAHARGTTPYGTGANTHVRPLREGKGSAYEGGTRVPLVVSWARRNDEAACQKALPIPAGAACDEPVICEDLFPTLAARAGLAAGERPQTVCDGVDWTRPFSVRRCPNDRCSFITRMSGAATREAISRTPPCGSARGKRSISTSRGDGNCTT